MEARMTPLEAPELNEVSGAMEREILEFLDRLYREMPPRYPEPIPMY
jgi:hypothetical protein